MKGTLVACIIVYHVLLLVLKTSILVTSDIAEQFLKVVSIFIIVQVVFNFFGIILPRLTSLILGDEEHREKTYWSTISINRWKSQHKTAYALVYRCFKSTN